MAPIRLRDLRGRGADSAADGVDQHPLPRLQAAAGDQRVPGGEKGLGNGGRLDERERLGNGQHFVLVDDDRFGVGAAADQAHDPVARTPAGGARPQRLDFAGVLEAGNVGGPAGRRRIVAAALMDVGAVEPGGADPDPDLARPRLRESAPRAAG